MAFGAGLVLLLVAYVLLRSGESFRDIGLTSDRLGANLARAVALTLLLFLCAGIVIGLLHALGVHGISTKNRLLLRWPYEPALIIESIRTALVEEVIVCGYLLHRLRQLGWSDGKALTASILVRSSYHVYGGIPLVAFTIVFGFILGRFYQRTRRLSAIVATHALYDATLFTIAIADNVHRLH
jgi:membrane protease YdiL (CAAX protease family)